MAKNIFNNGVQTNQFTTLPCTFKQISVDEMVYLPKNYPDIGEIKNTDVTCSIDKQTVITTPVGTSLEGQTLTGYKLIINGTLNFRVNYEPECPCNSYCDCFKFKIPFTTFLILPENGMYSKKLPLRDLIEYNGIEKCSDRSMYANVTLMLIADIC
ncbi:MAG: DUF3794 domain-containing protein [Romboutsia sp.]